MRSASFGHWLALLCFAFAASTAHAANPFVHPLFTSRMVLQRDASDPVWGWTTAGNTVTVAITDQNAATIQTKTTTADATGRWQVNLDPMGLVPGNAAYSMTVSASGQTTAVLTDILIGDVYLCSGQSNMHHYIDEYASMDNQPGLFDADILDSANYPQIRHFDVSYVSSFTPKETVGGSWSVSGTATTGRFSATGYFMAREIYKQQGVPVGLVTSAVGGTFIKAWMGSAFAGTMPDLALGLFDQQVQASTTQHTICGLHNGMIAPLAPFRFRATVWYQGESDAGTPEQYGRMLPGLMQSYRTVFSQPNLPFIVVQLPNYQSRTTKATETGSWAELRESQLKSVLGDPYSRLVTTIDLGDAINLHPTDKPDVGLRASWAAAELIYGQNVVSQGPIFTGATISGSTVRCSFSNIGAGLMVGTKPMGTLMTGTTLYPIPLSPIQPVIGGTLTGFALAGADKVFYTAQAAIDPATNTVAVSSTSVPNPVSVRYGWANNPACNLYNKITDAQGNVIDGLPASPFRNDSTYKLVVISGSGSGFYNLGDQVSISGSSLSGQTFDHWSGDTAYLSGTTNTPASSSIALHYQSVLANFRVTSGPTGLTGSSQKNQVTLTWTAMPGVRYTLKRASTPGGPYITISSNLTSPSYIDTSVIAGESYYYTVSAVGMLGEGPNATEIVAAPLPGPPGNAFAATLSWDPLQTTGPSNGSGAWDNSTTNFATSGSNVVYTPCTGATTNVVPFAAGTNAIAVTSASGLVRGLGCSLTQFPAGTVINQISGTNLTMSASGTVALSSTTAVTFSPIHTVIFGAASGTAGTVTVSGTQLANAMTLNPSGAGTYTFEGGGIRLGANHGATGMLVMNTSATINSNLNLKTISFTAGGQTLTLGGGGTLATLSGSTTSVATQSTVVLTSGTYSGAFLFKIGNPSAGTGGVVVGTGSGTVTANSSGGTFNLGQGAGGLVTVNPGGVLGASSSGLCVGRLASGDGKLLVVGGKVNSTVPLLIGFDGAAAGNVSISSGTISLTGNGTLGDIAISSKAGATATVASLNITGGMVSTGPTGAVSFGGGGGFTTSTAGSGTLNLTGGALYVGSGGIIKSGSGSFTHSILVSGGTIGALSNWSSDQNITLGTTNGNVTFQAGNTSGTPYNIALSGVLSGAGGLNKGGSGTLSLSRANNYSGSTLVSTGVLALVGNGSFPNSPLILVASGAVLDVTGLSAGWSVGPAQTLMGTGSVNGSLGASGIIAPGNTTGTLTVTGSATLNGTLVVNVNGGSSGKLVANGNLNLNGAALSIAASNFSGPYVIAQSTGGNLVGTFTSIPAGFHVVYTANQAILHDYASWVASQGVAGAAPEGDADGDGVSNLQEFLAGTDPAQSASVFRLNAAGRSGIDFVVRFPSIYGKLYRIESSNEPGSSAAWVTLQDNIPGTGALISGTDYGALLHSRRFYRVIAK